MVDPNRRSFLTMSLGAAAAWSAGSGMSAAVDADSKSADKADAKPETKSAAPQTVTGFVPGEPPSIFLTWWRDPTTTMVIQWIGPPTPNLVLHYGVLKSETKQTGRVQVRTFPDSPLKVHRCELTGLVPGTEYQFSIDDSKRSYRFRTMPAKATNTLTFVSGGDCGIGSAAVATNVLAAAQEPHFALVGGDLAYDNGKAPKGNGSRRLRAYLPRTGASCRCSTTSISRMTGRTR